MEGNNGILVIAEERIGKLEDIVIENHQKENQREKETEKQRVSGEKQEGVGGWRRERRRPWAHSPLLRGVQLLPDPGD